ncbi:Ldh family oxidoreductase [Rhodobacteraceae bacterium RKSG542]|uniref:Ldh family oxidoreductase n=1 Tax=Pseudovibrio flavus TaxID=2529854 RepID=UPI0012BCDA9D|nr:Ldh family oxidoreductase [Pseudovibrio flavus]MTI16031.1 Ldh family oxidoreductase [Pseudovibrio flavus]
MTDVIVKIDELKKLAYDKLVAAGLNEASAEEVADVLVYADSHGVRSHGVMRVEHYCKRLVEGGMNKNAEMSIDQISPSAAVLDSDDGMGHSGMKLATERAIEMAKETGIGFVSVKKTSHCGALAYFAEMAAEAGCVSICMTQTDACVAPFGGADKFFGTNPIAYGFPVEGKPPVIVDMATSAIAFGKILHAKETNGSLPDGVVLNKDGAFTTDPHEFACLTHFGEHKGYGIALAIDALTGVFMGAAFGPHINAMYGDYNKMRNLASNILVLDPAKFGTANYGAIMGQMVSELQSSRPAQGVDRVMVPGEPQVDYYANSLENGVAVAQPVYDYLVS